MIVLFNDSPQYPNRSVGVYRIATVLRKLGAEVEVIDYMAGWAYARDKLFAYLDKIENVEWWGFSGRYNVPNSIMTVDGVEQPWFVGSNSTPKEFETQVIQYIKNRRGKIVLGGPNAYALAKFLPEGYVDYICQGYSDTGIIALHEHIKTGAPIKSVAVKDFEVIDCNQDYAEIDLTDIDVYYHESDFFDEGEVFPIEIGRGCIFSCAFCSSPHIGKKAGTYIRPKESIKKDIVDRYTRYHTTRFLFLDDTFNDSVEKMELIKEIRDETGIPFEFWAYGRLELLMANPRMVDLMGEIGWKSVSFGIETFTKSSGSSVGKGAKPEKVQQFLIGLRERYPDLSIMINLIAGLPDDTKETVLATYQWFKDNPTVASQLKIQKLAIQVPNSKSMVSKISQNPQKYGYEIKPMRKPIMLMNWVNRTGMTQRGAKELVDQIQGEINRNWVPTDYSRAMIPRNKWIVSENGLYTIDFGNMVNRYIAKKLEYRGVGKNV
jgi:radical SAM superfamily enzyme YgiQ (UPF0313 family)